MRAILIQTTSLLRQELNKDNNSHDDGVRESSGNLSPIQRTNFVPGKSLLIDYPIQTISHTNKHKVHGLRRLYLHI